MKPANILTREALAVIWRAIERSGGAITVRNLCRNHFLSREQVDQAKEEGFIVFEVRKPPQGRPALVARKVSINYPTKLPPRRAHLESWISLKHWRFAFYYVMGEHGPGLFSFRRRAHVAYQKAYPNAKSKAGAKASASRLLRKPHVQAAIAWTFARRMDCETNCDGVYPNTTTEIWNTLHGLGNWRARHAPWWIQIEWARNSRSE